MNTAADKTIVITGASSGIGTAAARRLHHLGARVVPVGRDPGRTGALGDELGITAHTVDFADLDDVRRLAHELAELGPIDVLAANAGGIPRHRALTPDGIEPIFQVNAIGPWLLATLLAPQLATGRIVATSSRTHTGATLSPRTATEVATRTGGPGPHKAYARAKLAAGILLREFGRRHPHTVVADFHPGIIASDFGRYLGATGTLLTALAAPFLDSPADGAHHLVHLALTDEDINARYFVRDRPASGSQQLQDPALGTHLWDLAQHLTSRRP